MSAALLLIYRPDPPAWGEFVQFGHRVVHIAAARLGDTPTTVLNTYAHLIEQGDEVAAERVAASIGRHGDR